MRVKSKLTKLIVTTTWVCSSFTSQAFMRGGVVDKDGLFKSAVFLDLGGSLCSAVKIGTFSYLTAAHCLARTPDPEMDPSGCRSYIPKTKGPRKAMRIGTFKGMNAGVLKRICIHPSWLEHIDFTKDLNSQIGSGARLFDVAYIELSNSTDAEIAPIVKERVKGGSKLFFGGFGAKDDQGNGLGLFSYYATMAHIAPGKSNLFLLPSLNQDEREHEVRLDGGDSGGGAFMQNSEGKMELVGINSFIGLELAENADDGESYSFITRLVTKDELNPLKWLQLLGVSEAMNVVDPMILAAAKPSDPTLVASISK